MVGLGPGDETWRTPEATERIDAAEKAREYGNQQESLAMTDAHRVEVVILGHARIIR